MVVKLKETSLNLLIFYAISCSSFSLFLVWEYFGDFTFHFCKLGVDSSITEKEEFWFERRIPPAKLRLVFTMSINYIV